MAEQIAKFQPNRTVSLRGFDHRGAAAALHSATANGFKVSGVFRDQADFAVVMLYDADDYYEHPNMRYLPDFDLSGMVLEFDLHYSGLQPIDSPKFNWIDWATIDCITKNGEPVQRRLWDNAVLHYGNFTAASGTFAISASGVEMYDRLTIWFQNYGFDFIASHSQAATYDFFARGAGTTHYVKVNGTPYSFTESPDMVSADVAAALAAKITSPLVTATPNSFHITLAVNPAGDGGEIQLQASDGNANATLSMTTGAVIANNLAYQINTFVWNTDSPLFAIFATPTGSGNLQLTAARYGTVTAAGSVITREAGNLFVGLQAGDAFLINGFRYTIASVESANQLTLTEPGQNGNYLAPRGGRDGNMIEVYANAKNGHISTQTSIKFSGGSSDASWRVKLDFSELGIDQLRQAWLTLAPELTDSAAFSESIEWEAQVANIAITADPQAHGGLKIAGPGSVRVGSRDAWVERSGEWALQDGFYCEGFALVGQSRFDAQGQFLGPDTLTVKYACQFVHDLYLGTSLYVDRGIVEISLDGDAWQDLDCYLAAEPPVVSRRQIRQAVSAGEHTVRVRTTGRKHAKAAEWDADSQGYYFLFDYLDAVVATANIEPSTKTYPNVMPATDWDTDHTYKLPPARLLWNLYSMGFRGALNHYIGVFWWNQRRRVLGLGEPAFHTATVTFGGTWDEKESIFLYFDEEHTTGATLGKTTFGTDTPTSIARHFAAYINETFVGIWASTSGPTLTITTRSPWFSFALGCDTFNATGAGPSVAGTISISGDLDAGDEGVWEIDPDVRPVLNRAARDWHADFYTEIAGRGNTCATSLSMELVNAPDDPAGGKIWAARFNDDVPVTTGTGFSNLRSTHCTFMGEILSYQQEAFKELAQSQADAGLVPWVQFGEFLWWFFDWHDTNSEAGMAFYDAKTKGDAQAEFGRPLAWFSGRNADPSVNGYADANWLRSRIKSHVDAIRSYVSTAVPGTKYEFLYAHDVNYPFENSYKIGGPVNNYVNFPVEYGAKATSGLDRLKMESLSFGAQERNFDKQAISIAFPWTAPNSWAKSDTAYLMSISNGGCPWRREYLFAKDNNSPLMNMWAWDHIVLLSWPLPLPENEPDAQFS